MNRLLRPLRWVILGVIMLAAVYAGVCALPGDVVGVRSPTLTAEAAAARRHQLGLDQPVAERFLNWFTGLLQGDLATSSQSGRPVAELIALPVQNSIALATAALVIGLTVGIVAGAAAGYRQGGAVDGGITTLGVIVMACPEFILGTLLALVLGTMTGLLPTVVLAPVGQTVLADPIVMGLPTITLAVMCAATLSRSVRGVIAREMRLPYVASAQMSGIAPTRILFRHILPGCVSPIVQASVTQLPVVFGGAVVVEKIFGFPGIGALFVNSIASRDVPLAMAAALVLMTVSALAYATADAISRPRQVPA